MLHTIDVKMFACVYDRYLFMCLCMHTTRPPTHASGTVALAHGQHGPAHAVVLVGHRVAPGGVGAQGEGEREVRAALVARLRLWGEGDQDKRGSRARPKYKTLMQMWCGGVHSGTPPEVHISTPWVLPSVSGERGTNARCGNEPRGNPNLKQISWPAPVSGQKIYKYVAGKRSCMWHVHPH